MIPKPTSGRIVRAERKQARLAARRKREETQRKADAQADLRMRQAVYTRDHGKCRACLRPVRLHSLSALDVMHRHHVIYRSAQGPDTVDNSCALCARCHDLEHRHIIEIEGHPGETLRITLLDPQTLDVLEVRDSPVPGRWM